MTLFWWHPSYLVNPIRLTTCLSLVAIIHHLVLLAHFEAFLVQSLVSSVIVVISGIFHLGFSKFAERFSFPSTIFFYVLYLLNIYW